MTDHLKEATAMRDALKTWKEIHANYLRMQGTAMQLFSHPDAKDEDILRVARKLGEVRNSLLDNRHRLTMHSAYYRVNYANHIDGVKV